MASTELPAQLSTPVEAIGRMSPLRQVVLIVATAATIALAVAAALWLKEPSYSLLYAGLPDSERVLVVQALDAAAIPHRIDPRSGDIMVPGARVYDARFALAAQNLPHSTEGGFATLEGEQSLGASQLVERARYNHALEGELARTINSLSAVQSSRVHLAIPEPTVFANQNRTPSASVVVTVFRGRSLSDQQVAGIVHLVAASVPELEARRVSVLDQSGRLLTAAGGDEKQQRSGRQFDLARKLEQNLRSRILNMLAPLVGDRGVRAQVLADMDFTAVEETAEHFDPDKTQIRSEQITEKQSVGAQPVGIPGALSNQPPVPGGTGPAAATGAANAPTAAPAVSTPVTTDTNTTRNYELDRTISHTRRSVGKINRLSVAVVVDYAASTDASGATQRKPRSAEELDKFEKIVREAVGFVAKRGDTISVTTASFIPPPPAVAAPEVPLWQQPWVVDWARMLAAVALMMALLFKVLKPMLQGLTAGGLAAIGAGQAAAATRANGEPETSGAGGQAVLLDHSETDNADAELMARLNDQSQEKRLDVARQLVKDDPKRVARVVKGWITENG